MTAIQRVLKIRRPDDWHIHLRDDEMLGKVLPFTSAVFGRAIVMPNLQTPITTVTAAVAYRKRIMAAMPAGHNFTPLMTCYLTDSLNSEEVARGFAQGVFAAAKLYPANATTNSQCGVSDVRNIYPVLERMQKVGMPLLIHGEVTHNQVDIFDREARFIDEVMNMLRHDFPELKIVFEHITTREAVQYVLSSGQYLSATITPQHLMFNRNHMLVGGVRPHLFCLPVLKRSAHQEALRKAIASGSDRFFLGTDSAPHTRTQKESNCGCAGCFNAPLALSAYITVFDELNALQHFEAFCSLNGPRFYGLPLNKDFIELTRTSVTQPEEITLGNKSVVPFLAGQTLHWKVTSC